LQVVHALLRRNLFEVPMRRSTTQSLLSVGLLSFGVLALVPSCADNNSSLFVVGVIDTSAASCVAKPDTTVVMLANGVLDVGFTTSYTAFILVGNQLTQRGSREQLRTETSRVSLRGAEVTLTKVDGVTKIREYSTVGTGFVDAATGDVPAYSAMAVNIIPSLLGGDPAVQALGTVLAKIRVFGDTLGGTSVTSSELDFPISICKGCLIRYDTPEPADPSQSTCASTSSTTQTEEAAPCVLGQDQTVSCTQCAAFSDLCKKFPTTP
jgi:hypothetical protein